jgi:secreted trypsin-like serine protease
LFLIISFCCLSIWAKPSLIRLPRVSKGGRIIGGQVASAGEFPWQVAIYKDTADGRFFCAGALITEQFILTAAQCVYEATQFTIQMGSNQLESTDSNRVTVTATNYIINERFDPTVSLAHDVAVIKLDSPITPNDYIQPIVYVNMGYLYPGAVCTAAGWGQTSDASTDLTNDLNYVEVSIIDQFECQAYYGDQLWNSMICAVGTTNQGICLGDVGGAVTAPVNYWVGNYSVVVAIASWVSQNGCESTDPTGYTRVDSYYDWITNAIKDE